MAIAQVFKGVGFGVAGIAGLVAGTAAAERALLRRMEATQPPAGWESPRWPGGRRLMVPTDDGAELVVEITGDASAPTIVLVHGLSGDHESWGPVATALAGQGHRVIGVNQRGHGGSTVGQHGFGDRRLGTDLGQVLGALDLEDVVVAGHSMGGLAAMALMTLTPQAGAGRVGALALVATLADAVRADRAWSLELGGADWYRRLGEHPVHAPVLARGVFGRTPSRVMVDDILEVAQRCPTEISVAASRGMLGYDIRHHLPTISVPTTVVCGTRDLLTSHAENVAIAEAIPDADFISVPDAGHMVIWEQPDVVVSATADLAARLQSSVATS